MAGYCIRTFWRYNNETEVFNTIQYNTIPGEIFFQYLYHDFQKDELKLIEIMPEDLVGGTIRHLYTDQDSGENVW